jgi:hypothetical protein
MRSHAGAVLVGRSQVVRADSDQTAVTDFHFPMEFDQTLCLPTIFWTEASPAENQDHRIGPLQIRELAVFARVIG